MDSRQATRLIPHLEYDKAQTILFEGKRGNGKTDSLQNYVEVCEPRVLILDPFEDFKMVRRRVRVDDALDDLAYDGDGIGPPCRRRLVPPIDGSSIEYAEEVFAKILERQDVRNFLFVLDEITLWSNSIPTKALTTLVLQGRRLGIRMAVACQRIALVPSVILSECTTLVIFKTTRPRDLYTIELWAGKEAAEIAPRLARGQCLLVDL